MKFQVSRSKRLWIVAGALFLNFATVWFGIHKGVDLTALGTCLAMINAPLYVYVFGESWRPSKPKQL